MSNRCLLCSTVTYTYKCTTKPHVSYQVCPACGFTSLDEMHILDPELEKQRYLLHQNSKLDTNYLAWLEIFITTIKQYLKPDSFILDFGSGPNPVLADLLTSKGYKVTLYDPYFAPNAVAFENRYHAIVIHEVIEHLAHPLISLQELIPLLKLEGFLAIRTQVRPLSDEAFDTFWYRKDLTHRSFFMKKTCFALGEHLQLLVSFYTNDIFIMKKQEL